MLPQNLEKSRIYPTHHVVLKHKVGSFWFNLTLTSLQEPLNRFSATDWVCAFQSNKLPKPQTTNCFNNKVKHSILFCSSWLICSCFRQVYLSRCFPCCSVACRIRQRVFYVRVLCLCKCSWCSVCCCIRQQMLYLSLFVSFPNLPGIPRAFHGTIKTCGYQNQACQCVNVRGVL